ncbi:MAG: dipeptidyl-peptidase 3 family protein, partial [Mycoplasma sp.]
DEKKEEFPNAIDNSITVVIYYGEFSAFLKKVNHYLNLSTDKCSNEIEKKMMGEYIESFKTGSIEKHKDSQRSWIKDKGPVIEMNIGWIETYIDPIGVRGYYEGWVAIKDKEQSKKFNTLVDNSEKLLKEFPWSIQFEKDKFCAPDFIALDVVTYASDGCPIGINIPNYSDVQEQDGFKNISLSNAYPSFKPENWIFCWENDKTILSKHALQAMTVMVGLHELLGHGSGKLLRKNENGEFNFDHEKLINPLTNKVVDQYYEGSSTYEQKFMDLGRSMEECRADLTALYFVYNKTAHSIFDITDENLNDTIYSMYLIHFRKGILGLPLYNANNCQWGQAHTQGAFVVM